MCLRVMYDLLYIGLEMFIRLMKDNVDLHWLNTHFLLGIQVSAWAQLFPANDVVS